MRLYKKAAAVLLAAAMAVSMMTACGTTGGGNGGNGGNNGGKPGTSEGGDEKPGKPEGGEETPDKPEGGEETPDKPGDSVIPAEPTKVTWDTSLTKKYFQGLTSNNFCMSGALIKDFAEDGEGPVPFAYATQGEKQIMLRQGKGENGKKIYMASFLDKDGQMYAALCDKMPTSVSDISNWQTAEATGADKEAIETTKDDMNEYKNVTCPQNIVDGMFHAMVQDGVYVESVMMKVGSAVYTCAYAFNDQGNMVSMSVGQNNVPDYVFIPATNSKIKTCPDDAFPNNIKK